MKNIYRFSTKFNLCSFILIIVSIAFINSNYISCLRISKANMNSIHNNKENYNITSSNNITSLSDSNKSGSYDNKDLINKFSINLNKELKSANNTNAMLDNIINEYNNFNDDNKKLKKRIEQLELGKKSLINCNNIIKNKIDINVSNKLYLSRLLLDNKGVDLVDYDHLKNYQNNNFNFEHSLYDNGFIKEINHVVKTLNSFITKSLFETKKIIIHSTNKTDVQKANNGTIINKSNMNIRNNTNNTKNTNNSSIINKMKQNRSIINNTSSFENSYNKVKNIENNSFLSDIMYNETNTGYGNVLNDHKANFSKVKKLYLNLNQLLSLSHLLDREIRNNSTHLVSSETFRNKYSLLLESSEKKVLELLDEISLMKNLLYNLNNVVVNLKEDYAYLNNKDFKLNREEKEFLEIIEKRKTMLKKKFNSLEGYI